MEFQQVGGEPKAATRDLCARVELAEVVSVIYISFVHKENDM